MNPDDTAAMHAMDADDAARMARLARPDALALAACWYAWVGIPVFPLHPGGKRPATRHGFHDATTEPGTVARWWADEPAANIGIPTGILFDVIDVDPPDGYTSLAVMRAGGLVPPVHGYVLTPRGAHLYIRPTGEGNTAGLRPDVDYRGRGGYVVAPPSRTDTGMWVWSTPLDLPALGIAPADEAGPQ